jgi:hypothetical protein
MMVAGKYGTLLSSTRDVTSVEKRSISGDKRVGRSERGRGGDGIVRDVRSVLVRGRVEIRIAHTAESQVGLLSKPGITISVHANRGLVGIGADKERIFGLGGTVHGSGLAGVTGGIVATTTNRDIGEIV